MKYLKPFALKNSYWEQIEKEIAAIFDKLIFFFFFRDLKITPEIRNRKSPLIDALHSGAVYFQDGAFYGTFNSGISRELKAMGATYSRYYKRWTINPPLPADISIAIADAASYGKQAQDKFIRTLDAINPDAIPTGALRDEYGRTIDMMNTDMDSIVKSISVPPQLTTAAKRLIAEEWSENLELYIKGWIKEDILKLRQTVQERTFSGLRAEGLAKILQKDREISKAKAKFLARQETSLLMSKFREQRFADAGVTKYRWSTSHDSRVRESHRRLNGKIFFFSDPPVVDDKGNRANAGEDFGCLFGAGFARKNRSPISPL